MMEHIGMMNGDYESENTRATGDDYDGVTGLGIFDSKIVEVIQQLVVTPPVPIVIKF